jgi:penicillin-binding protein-related factor A (putative recombinase)
MTPEGKVKQKIKVVLDTYREQGVLYYHMNVPVGYGKSTLDYLGFICGLGFAIEAKAPKKKPSDRQLAIIEDIDKSGAPVFVIDGVEGLTRFNDWCQEVVALRVG